MSEGENPRTSGWARELRETIAAIEKSTRTLAALNDHVWNELSADDVFPREIPDQIEKLLRKLAEELGVALKASKSSFDRHSGDPVAHLFAGKELSREEYFLLLAMGATEAELPESTRSREKNSDAPFPDAG